MTVQEIWIGIPLHQQQEMLDKGYTLQPHASGPRRTEYVMAIRKKPQIRWTQEEADILERYWGIRTARQIGKVLGRTRGSVIGKANRLGLVGE